MLPKETLQIQDGVGFRDDGFSMTRKLGSFINNKRFSEGYVQFGNGEQNTKTYVWEALSAIGDDLGKVVYSNVLNYIDNVSNVETCRIQALDSMMKEIGIEYGVFDIVGRFPHGIVSLMDIFSIDMKYVVGGDLLKGQTVEMLEDGGAVYNLSSDE